MPTQTRIVPFELKGADEDGAFTGHASVFGVVDDHNEIVAPGAFAKTIAEKGARGVKLLWQHAADKPIGVLEDLREDKRGLFVKGRLLLALEQAREAHVLLKSGALDGLSIGFVSRKSEREPETGFRRITEIDLWEVSLVTFPANPEARIAAAKARASSSERGFEQFLREAGFSRSEAKAITAKGFRAARPSREAEGALEALCASLDRARAILSNPTKDTP